MKQKFCNRHDLSGHAFSFFANITAAAAEVRRSKMLLRRRQ